jgi:protein O-mannosyl-transferase
LTRRSDESVLDEREGSGRRALVVVAILLATVAAYLSAIHGGFIWDDDAYVSQNLLLRTVGGLAKIWTDPSATPQYYPLVHTLFWLEYHVWGTDPVGYHAVNIVLHALSAILLLGVLRRLRFPAAELTAFLFALHPVEVESVAWITEGKNVLSGVFYFASLSVALRYFLAEEPGAARPRLLVEAFVLFVLALLSKSVTATLPVVILLILYWKRGRVSAAEVLKFGPFLAVGAASGLFTAFLEKVHVGAEGLAWSWTLIERFLIAGRALWFYMGKIVWPTDLTFIYPRWHVSQAVWWQYLFPLAAAAVFYTLWKAREKIGRGPLVAALCFAVTLFPALGFFAVYPMRYSFVADHFQYLASVPIFALVAFSLRRVAEWVGPELGQGGLPAVVVVLLGVLTWHQTGMYRSQETLWRETIRRNPESSMAENNLGVFLITEGRVEEGAKHVSRAIQLDPRDYEALAEKAYLLSKKGDISEAIRLYKASLAIQPRYAPAAYGLGNQYRRQGKSELAIEMYQRAIASEPGYRAPMWNLTLLLANLGRWGQASEVCALALPGVATGRFEDLCGTVQAHVRGR